MPQFLDDLSVQGAMVAQASAEQTTQVVKLAAGQTTPFTEFETSTGEVLASVDYTGRFKGLFSAYDQAVLLDSPGGYWPLSDPLGSSSAQDLSGGAIGAMAVTGGVTFGNVGPTGDPLETSALFDGTSGYLETAGSSSIFSPSGPWSVGVWVNHQGVAWSSAYEMVVADAHSYIAVLAGQPVVRVTAITGAQVSVGPLPFTIPTVGWHYLRAVWDGTNLTLSTDDQSQATAFTQGAGLVGGPVAIGQFIGYYFKGLIAKVEASFTALSATRQTVRAAAAWKERTDFYSASGSSEVPAWASVLEIDSVSPGGSGGGGGSAASGSTTAQGPGSGGTAGMRVRKRLAVIGGQPVSWTVGAQGAVGVGGQADTGAGTGYAGTNAGGSGDTTVTVNGVPVVHCVGGRSGQGSAANSTVAAYSDFYQYGSGNDGEPWNPGTGAGAGGIYPEAPMADGLWGGGVGGFATATKGGGPAAPPGPVNTYSSPGANGGSSTASGVVSPDTTEPGCGGCGGAGGAAGGAGANGSKGGPGYVSFTWKAA